MHQKMTTDISLSPIPKFVALGNGVWLDEIRVGLKPPIRNVPGGSVTFGKRQSFLYCYSYNLTSKRSYDWSSDVHAGQY